MSDPTPVEPVEPARKAVTPARAPRWLVVTLFLLLIGGGVIVAVQYGSGVSELVQYDREETQRVVNGELCRALSYRPRGAPPGDDPVLLRAWSPTSGFLVLEAEALPDGKIRTTVWTSEGKMFQQTEFQFGSISTSQHEPPWQWGKKDQSVPSVPEELQGEL